MNVTIRKISGIDDAINTMYISKRTWTPKLEQDIYDTCERILDRKGFIKVYSPLVWTVAPAAYMLVAYNSAVLGNGIGVNGDSKYPYFFMDVDKLGIPTVVINTLIIAVIYFAVGYIYYFIDRLMIRRI